MTTDAEAGESLSARLGFPETAVEVGFAHPAVRHVMTGVGGSASFLVHLDDDRITDLEVDIGLGHRGFRLPAGQPARGGDEALRGDGLADAENGGERRHCRAGERGGAARLPVAGGGHREERLAGVADLGFLSSL